ncbi:MAG TPA: methyltransferase domain-containing protein [Thermohalobaculum sp.]|nr:methyltransferase domain-containing protein [Thermohalobaculum sp.]
MSHDRDLYDDASIVFLERLWGKGYLSPGGWEEVARVLDGLDVAGRTLVDIGCGAGGVAIDIVRQLNATRVIGLDVEAGVCAVARRHVEEAGLGDRIEILQVEPGPLPLPDRSVDIVFSKDSIVHIPDKEVLAAEAFRVLRPGGWFAASDWLIAHDGAPSPEMASYIESEDLDFALASPGRYRKALEGAGFEEVRLVDRNPWYREQARAELARLEGPERAEFEALVGADDIAHQIQTWQRMTVVLDTGEHCPHHFRGRRPAG